MAWNEPGGNGDKGNDRDPWSGKPKKQGPPDLDKLFSDFQKKVSGVVGKKGFGGSDDDGGPPGPKAMGAWIISLLIIVLIFWSFMGFFKVQEAEEAVILRFGKYTETVGPGLHWIPPIVDTQFSVDVQQRNAYTYSAKMLTKDENIVSVGAAVQYRRADPEAFLFNVSDPIVTMEQATASALRQAVGNMKLDDILTKKRDQVSADSEKQLVSLMKKYGTGIEITNFTLDVAKPPDEVQEAFDDVIKAGQDKERYIKKAHAYEAQVSSEVEGKIRRIAADAEAYQKNVILNAQGEVARFLALLPEYNKAPKVTRERLYLSTIETILRASSKVIIDVDNNNVVYLPLEKMIPPRNAGSSLRELKLQTDVNVPAAPSSTTQSSQGNASSNNSNQSYLSFSNRDRSAYTGRGNQ